MLPVWTRDCHQHAELPGPVGDQHCTGCQESVCACGWSEIYSSKEKQSTFGGNRMGLKKRLCGPHLPYACCPATHVMLFQPLLMARLALKCSC